MPTTPPANTASRDFTLSGYGFAVGVGAGAEGIDGVWVDCVGADVPGAGVLGAGVPGADVPDSDGRDSVAVVVPETGSAAAGAVDAPDLNDPAASTHPCGVACRAASIAARLAAIAARGRGRTGSPRRS